MSKDIRDIALDKQKAAMTERLRKERSDPMSILWHRIAALKSEAMSLSRDTHLLTFHVDCAPNGPSSADYDFLLAARYLEDAAGYLRQIHASAEQMREDRRSHVLEAAE